VKTRAGRFWADVRGEKMKILSIIVLILACSIGTRADTLIDFSITGGIQAQGVIDVSSIPKVVPIDPLFSMASVNVAPVFASARELGAGILLASSQFAHVIKTVSGWTSGPYM
jgi:hypothetical protein